MSIISNEDFIELRKTLQRGAGAIFVLGAGFNNNGIPYFRESDAVRALHSDNPEDVAAAWGELFELSKGGETHKFFQTYTKYVYETAPVKAARFEFLTTGYADHCRYVDKRNSSVLNLNGLLNQGFDSKSGMLKRVSTFKEASSLQPLFPSLSSNYKMHEDAVESLEKTAADFICQTVFFLGSSGSCPVTESIYNRSLVSGLSMRTNIVVVNSAEENYMYDNASLVYNVDAVEFLDELHERFLMEDKDYARIAKLCR
ncbi:hypothetical protein [Vibrio alginolyticus]|uniref:hypothetical protein n=1 Tax=Vibrio alginolyticus TaxID=663 RepID=UPI0006CA9851|nr:hypothetical protein [Vibrio alginolyticus]KPM98600.1 hypothetical protein AOG25_09190 [Vibrio alginolyticus]CAH7159005.1 conserved hypothetical protein [Vibrio chagasii]CAH7328479.1 conserved hypothetical protein [Vibrio chagasii]